MRAIEKTIIGLLTHPLSWTIFPSFPLNEGALMRRHDCGAGCGARGRGETHLTRSGGDGAPPGDTKTPRQELADGAKPLVLPGQKRLGAQKGRGSAASGGQ